MSGVLLTGATGFIGRHALDLLLAEGREVHAVARTPGPVRDGVEWHAADLLAPGEADRIAAAAAAAELLHLGWYAVPGKFWDAPENALWATASARLLRAFGEAGGSRAVMAGTCAEYRWGDPVLSEHDTPLEPATPYGAAKHSTRIECESISQELGVSFAWGRVFFLYGPHEPLGRLVSSVCVGLIEGEDVPTTDGHQLRDFMHVLDVARAFTELISGELQGPVNVGTGQAVPVREIIRTIAAAAGASDHVRFGALPTRKDEPEAIAADTRRLFDELGFAPRIDLGRGLGGTVEWWRASLAAQKAGRARGGAR